MTISTSPRTTKQRVTFVGVGAIGLPMAKQVLRHGHEVVAVDPGATQRESAEAAGLRASATPESAAEADVVICMVATPDQLRTVAIGSDGVLSRMRAGSIFVVMSTVGPQAVIDLVSAAPEGVHILDAPVTGGVARARTGDLLVFAAGPDATIATARPVLEAFGSIVECGPDAGQGQAYKAVNQLLCSVHIVAAAEALALAERLGLDPERVLPAVAGGAGGSWMLSDRGPRMLQGLDAEVTSAIEIFVKDASLVTQIADDIGFEAPLIAAARAKYLDARDAGLGKHDDSQVIATYRQQHRDQHRLPHEGSE